MPQTMHLHLIVGSLQVLPQIEYRHYLPEETKLRANAQCIPTKVHLKSDSLLPGLFLGPFSKLRCFQEVTHYDFLCS